MDNNVLNINDEREVRLKKMRDLLDLNINPYPASVKRSHTLKEALSAGQGEKVSVVGRLMTKRDMGKLTFCHIQDGTEKMQIALSKADLGDENYNLFVKKIDIGDIVEIHGERFLTHKGEESILTKEWRILTKALLPLPDKFHGIQDDELRYRKRYLDFIFNADAKEKILTRARMLKAFRDFLNEQGFVEVETPMLEVVASGAMAESFDTHYNAYDLPVHLRICIGELWQKRLMVGGFEKTFEIGRAFRNEGVDAQHNPEFTMIEYYWAYADARQNMDLHEKLIPYLVEKSIGKLEVEHNGEVISFKAPYPRVTFREVVLQHSGIDLNEYSTTEALKKVMMEKGYEVEETAERGKLMDSLYKQAARPKLVQPTFVLDYPIELKPLAKKSDDPRYTDMFQLIVSGFELSNSYTELNDPVDQRERFMEQARIREAGEAEAMDYDKDYVEAMEHGMPPITGTGIGIDRFVALLTGAKALREILAFPLMKPVGEVQETINEEESKK